MESGQCRSVARDGREDYALPVGHLIPFPPTAWAWGFQTDLVAKNFAHKQPEAFVTVETNVPVTFDVKHEVVGVRAPVSNYGVIAVICSDGLQNITLFLGGQRSGLFEGQRRMSLRHGLRLTTFAKVRNGSKGDSTAPPKSGRHTPSAAACWCLERGRFARVAQVAISAFPTLRRVTSQVTLPALTPIWGGAGGPHCGLDTAHLPPALL